MMSRHECADLAVQKQPFSLEQLAELNTMDIKDLNNIAVQAGRLIPPNYMALQAIKFVCEQRTEHDKNNANGYRRILHETARHLEDTDLDKDYLS